MEVEKESRKNGNGIGPAVRADFRRLYPANAKTSTCCPSDDDRTKVTNSVTSARSPLVARWPVFLARGCHADGEPHMLVSPSDSANNTHRYTHTQYIYI